MITEDRNCEIHGEYESRQICNYWSDCPKCSAIRQEEEYQKRKQQEEIERRAKWLKGAGITDRFEGKTFDAYNPVTPAAIKIKNEVMAYAKRIVDDDKNGESLIFVGKPGTGKTHLASSLVYYMIDNNKCPKLITALNMIRAIRDTWSKNSDKSEEQVIHNFVSYHLLIIDEIGVQYGSEAEKIIFFEILNRRYESRKPTVLMSNLPLPELKGYLGDRIFDRLKEDDGKVFVFDWDSHRGTK